MASMTWRGFCEEAAESRYTKGTPSESFPPWTRRSRIGKSLRTRSTSKTMSGRFLDAGVLLIALGLQHLGQLRAAGLDDPPGREDVHVVRLDVAQDPGV